MNKTLSILLVLIFFYLTTGYFIRFLIVRYQVRSEIKSEIKAGMPESELFKITVDDKNSNKLKWEETGKEFELDGKMFDVVRSIKEKGQIIYWCYNDKKEESLFANLNNTVHNTMNGDSKYKSVFKYFAFQFYHCKSESKEIQSFIRINRFSYHENTGKVYIKVLLPPPKSV